jgi:uncharacterized protein YodC (DUF2158 family)
MNATFAPGDTVRLKSGGPVMTVTEASEAAGVLTVWVTWFAGTTQSSGTFPATAVEKVMHSTGAMGQPTWKAV